MNKCRYGSFPTVISKKSDKYLAIAIELLKMLFRYFSEALNGFEIRQ
jgi:hypothetical protein